jgi:hypothetical protein
LPNELALNELVDRIIHLSTVDRRFRCRWDTRRNRPHAELLGLTVRAVAGTEYKQGKEGARDLSRVARPHASVGGSQRVGTYRPLRQSNSK